MSLSPGTRFGSYEVVAPIGAGGMGEVYRAKDTKLKREVALKVLPQAFVADADRLTRFQREAEILASLNHPNIAQIYGLEQGDGQTVIVMELILGLNLAEKIKAGPIAVDEAMGIALQVVAALEAAHARQIVHRDLKPANVKLKPDGTVKVLDFGISKPIDRQAISGGSPVMTTPAVTQTGVILGTAAYMSPEQARGLFVDERTDIWAFGCLLFEMLTGQPAFGGEDVMLTLARVLDRPTDLSSIPRTISPAVRHTIKLCLEKNPRKRIADIRDVRLALEGTFESAFAGVAGSEDSAPRPLWKRALRPAVPLLAGAALALAAAYSLWPAMDRNIVRFPIDFPGAANSFAMQFALAPDGNRIVYLAGGQLYSRRLDQDSATPLAGTEGAREPFFAPDGASVAYFTDSQLKTVGFAGEQPRVVADTPSAPGFVGVWDSQDRIFFGQGGGFGLSVVAARGGIPEPFAALGDYNDLDYPDVLPGGDWVIFSAMKMSWGQVDIVAQHVATGERRLVLADARFARYIDSGHLAFVRDQTLYAVGFDPERVEVTGTAVPLIPVIAGNESSGHAAYAVAANGTLVYMPNSDQDGSYQLVHADLAGNLRPLPADPRDYGGLRVSPDGSRIAVEVTDPATGHVHILVIDLQADTAIQLTYTGEQNFSPLWTPDGLEVLYSSDRDGGRAIYRKAADGSTEARLVVEGSDALQPTDVAAGNVLLFQDSSSAGTPDIFTLDLDDGGSPSPFLATDAVEILARASPDGEWVTYAELDGAGFAPAVFVRPFAAGGAAKTLTGLTALAPIWSRTGDRIYFVALAGPDPQLMSAPLQYSATTVTPGRAEAIAVLDTRFRVQLDSPALRGLPIDVLEYGGAEGFVVVRALETPGEPSAATRPQMNVVLNWFEEVRQRVPRE